MAGGSLNVGAPPSRGTAGLRAPHDGENMPRVRGGHLGGGQGNGGALTLALSVLGVSNEE